MPDAPAAPPLNKLLREGWGLLDLTWSNLRPPVIVPRAGRGQPVIVIPGMVAGDATVNFLRRSLRASGFDPYPSDIVFHLTARQKNIDRVVARLRAVHQSTGQKVALIGWSLGGLFARVIAQAHPELVSAVLTLGAPFSGDLHANNAWRLYEALDGGRIEDSPFASTVANKPPVPTVALWSAEDGIISSVSARGLPHESDRQEELHARHLDLASNAASVRRIIEVLGEVL